MAKLLSAMAEGSIVKLKESGALVDFYVAEHDYESGLNGTGRTLLARAEPWPTDVVWNDILENAYADSTIDRWLNNDYKNNLDPSIRAQITETQFYYTVGNDNRNTVPLSRDIFILSGTELDISADRMKTEGKISPIADELRSTRGNEWTRSPRYNLTTSAWRGAKNTSTAYEADVTYAFPVRPVFQLPSTLAVSDDGVIIAPPLAPNSITVPDTTMQGNTLPVSWTAADGADSYVLERSADSGAWTQVYSGAELSYTDTAGTWGTVQYRVKAGASGVYGDYTTSAAVAVVPASTCTISGEDGDLGTLTGDIVYTAMTSTSEPITVTETVNGTVLRTFQPVSGAQQRISVMDLPTGGGTAEIKAECSGVSVTRTWTYTKAAEDFPAAGTPFDIALLSKGGRVQFPQTLAECVRMPGGERLGDVLSTQIGDTLTTARNDLGSNWLLCNGDLVSKEQYPELWDVLSKSQEAEGIGATYQEINDAVSSGRNQYCGGIAYGNGYWVICVSHDGREDLGVYYSTDKVSWTYKLISSGRQNSSAYRIRFVNGYFVICASISGGAEILYTQDPSANWSSSFNAGFYACVDILYVDNTFVACVNSQNTNGISILYSSAITDNFSRWSSVTVAGYGETAYSMSYVNGYWVVCGNHYSSSSGNQANIWYTQNYKGSWISNKIGTDGAAKGILYNSKQYMIYGGPVNNKAAIWYGDSLDTLTHKEIAGNFSDVYDFIDGVRFNGITILLDVGEIAESKSELFYLYDELITSELNIPSINISDTCGLCITEDTTGFMVGCGNQFDPIAAIEVWDKKLMQKLPTITNDLTYTYIKARKGS